MMSQKFVSFVSCLLLLLFTLVACSSNNSPNIHPTMEELHKIDEERSITDIFQRLRYTYKVRLEKNPFDHALNEIIILGNDGNIINQNELIYNLTELMIPFIINVVDDFWIYQIESGATIQEQDSAIPITDSLSNINKMSSLLESDKNQLIVSSVETVDPHFVDNDNEEACSLVVLYCFVDDLFDSVQNEPSFFVVYHRNSNCSDTMQ